MTEVLSLKQRRGIKVIYSLVDWSLYQGSYGQNIIKMSVKVTARAKLQLNYIGYISYIDCMGRYELLRCQSKGLAREVIGQNDATC